MKEEMLQLYFQKQFYVFEVLSTQVAQLEMTVSLT